MFEPVVRPADGAPADAGDVPQEVSGEVSASGAGCWAGTLTTLPPALREPWKAGGNDRSTGASSLGLSSSWR